MYVSKAAVGVQYTEHKRHPRVQIMENKPCGRIRYGRTAQGLDRSKMYAEEAKYRNDLLLRNPILDIIG